MFDVKNSELVIDGVLWVFKLDPLVTSVIELKDPKPYIYKGRFSKHMQEYLLVEDDDLTEHKIFVDFSHSETSTGNYIISNRRNTLVNKLRILSVKNITIDLTYKLIAKAYIKELEESKPEWIL